MCGCMMHSCLEFFILKYLASKPENLVRLNDEYSFSTSHQPAINDKEVCVCVCVTTKGAHNHLAES